jgi:hypothetical protein
MAEQGSEERAGCMECHAQQPYTVETLANRNTVWRCVVCNHVVNLIPGKYRSDLEEAGP